MAASADNKALARLFSRMSRVLDLKGENPFKAIAFFKVKDVLENMPQDIRAVFQGGGKKAVEGISGIGGSSAKIICDWLETGRSPDYEELTTSVPEGLIDMMAVPGLGPKTVRMLWQERNVTTIDQLSRALTDGTLDGLRGIGKKKIEQIQQGIEAREASSQRRTLGVAIRAAEGIAQQLREVEGVDQVQVCGSVRRCRETIGDLDFVVTAKKGVRAGDVLERFSKFPQFDRILGLGDTKSSAVTHDGLQVDCRVVPPASFGAAVMYFTGSKQHNIRLRSIAQNKGFTLNEWGLYDAKAFDAAARKPGEIPTVKPVAGATEEEIYRWFKMELIPPELREDSGEIEAALKGELPKLVTLDDYRGDLHTHSQASDGIATVEEMAEAAMRLGYKFLAITDHSKTQTQAGGLDVARLMKHIAAIRSANDRIKGIELLAGSEVDILVDGRLDYEDAVLAELDWVVASPHVSLRQEPDKATARILRAIENPYVNVIGHPTGRLVNGRAGLPLDFAAVFKAAAQTGTALEINANYARLDLADVQARAAIDAGCVLAINTDAHSVVELEHQLAGGMGVARRAWATKKDVINCLTVAQLKKFVAKKRP